MNLTPEQIEQAREILRNEDCYPEHYDPSGEVIERVVRCLTDLSNPPLSR